MAVCPVQGIVFVLAVHAQRYLSHSGHLVIHIHQVCCEIAELRRETGARIPEAPMRPQVLW